MSFTIGPSTHNSSLLFEQIGHVNLVVHPLVHVMYGNIHLRNLIEQRIPHAPCHYSWCTVKNLFTEPMLRNVIGIVGIPTTTLLFFVFLFVIHLVMEVVGKVFYHVTFYLFFFFLVQDNVVHLAAYCASSDLRTLSVIQGYTLITFLVILL